MIGAAKNLTRNLPVKGNYVLFADKQSLLNSFRKPMSAATGFEFADAAPLRCDLDAPENFIGSAAKRIASETNPIDDQLFSEFTSFVDDWLDTNLQPLSYDTDLSFETWLESTNYSSRRKQQLRDVFSKRFEHPNKHYEVKMFGKDETYADWKYMRGILPRDDYFKCFLGPFMKAIEKEVYKLPYFIKHIPERERPEYIMNNVYQPGALNFVSDHTSFEAAFTADMMRNLERKLYLHMTKSMPEQTLFSELIDVICNVNIVRGKECTFKTEGRMSGEMCTSLGNGFSNLMVMLFSLKRAGVSSIKGVVEGDDGLFTFYGEPPTVEDFAKIGFRLKLESFDSFSKASFCGMIFDEDDKIIITDGIDSVLKMGWSSRQYTMASGRTLNTLLRSKALSYAHMYWRCPIIGAASRAAMRLTADVGKNELRRFRSKERISLYEFEERELNEKVALGTSFVPMNTRILYEQVFGVAVSDQLRIEEYFDNLSRLGNLRCPFLSGYFTHSSIDYNNMYVVREPHLFGYPPIPDFRQLIDIRHILSRVRLR